MWPWAHAAVGYLLYALVLRVTDPRRPEGVAVLALALGTQLPDLLDKTLAWYLHVLPYVEGSPMFLFGLVLTAAALGLWARHGYPGLAELRNGLVAVAESTRP